MKDLQATEVFASCMGPSASRGVVRGQVLYGLFTTLALVVIAAALPGRCLGAQEPSAQEEPGRAAEARALALVLEYYVSTIPAPAFSTRSQRWPASCIGVSLEDCFGGDFNCSLPFGGNSVTRRECTAPQLPAARAELLDKLDSLAALAPGSDWIASKRVSFALMNGDVDRAVAAAQSCRATPWWCQALRGYAMHERRPGSGGAHLDSAFAGAPPGTPAWAQPPVPGAGDRGLHCEWSDLGYVITGGVLRMQYLQMPCGDNHEFESRFWWMADPLWSDPGNARRDEHMTRNIQMRLHDEHLRPSANHAHLRSSTRHPADLFHGEDHDLGHSAVIPVGVPNSWRGVPYTMMSGTRAMRVTATGEWDETERRPDGSMPGGRPLQLRHGFVNGGYSFTPDSARFHDPLTSTPEDWAVTWNEGHERMITPETWYNAEHHQTAVLRRGEHLLALAAARLPVVVPSFDSVQAALAMGRHTDLRIEVAQASVEPTGVVRASLGIPDGEWLASIEMRGEDWVGRARYGAPAPELDQDGFGLSTPVLLEDRLTEERPLLERILPGTDLSGRSTAGIYFEVYGVSEDEPLRVTLSTEPVQVQRGLLARIGRVLRLRGEPDVARDVNWLEAAETAGEGVMSRYLALDLTGLRAGEYDLVVEVERNRGDRVRASRRMRLAPVDH